MIADMLVSFFSVALMFLELIVIEMIFGKLLTKRDQFASRLVISLLIGIAVIFLVEVVYCYITGAIFSYGTAVDPRDSIFKFFFYCFIYLMSIGIMLYCFRNPLWLVLFYAAGGYAAQHLSANITMLFRLLPGYNELISGAVWLSFLIEIGVCVAIYSVVYLLFIRGKVLQQNESNIKRKVIFSLSVIIICIGISRLTSDNVGRNQISFIAEILSAIVNCVFILMLHFNFTENEGMHNEVSVLEGLLRREKEQLKLSKENIEQINIKCHDLKHQINALRQNASPEILDELEKSVMIYDSQINTGNKVLDIILTEKSMYCVKNKIRLQCMADGKNLDFMDSMDIYSLFGNILSNAIESVVGVDEKRRFIALNVSTENKLLTVHTDNYYDGEILFEDGLPVTQKDRGYHGFGVKSMNYIVKKYGGHMSMIAENGVFSLDIVFPMTEQNNNNKEI